MANWTTFALILTIFGLSSKAFAGDVAGCLPSLERALCYSPPMEHWAIDQENIPRNLRAYQERRCLPVPTNLKTTLLSVYDKFPREIQQAFCEIKKIFIVSGDVSYGALADFYFDPATVRIQQGEWNPRFSGKPIGYVLEISEKNRFKGETASAYATRVLRARFGSAAGNVEQLPLGVYETPFAENGALATTIVHEIGHMLGRAQKMTSTYFLPFSEGAWSKVSFKLEDGSYSLRHATPEYSSRMLQKTLSNSDVRPTLDLFRRAGVATLYGATSPQEDLAEFFMLNYYGNLKWSLQGEVVFDLQREIATNAAFKTKKDIINRFMSQPEPFSLKNRGVVSGELGPM